MDNLTVTDSVPVVMLDKEQGDNELQTEASVASACLYGITFRHSGFRSYSGRSYVETSALHSELLLGGDFVESSKVDLTQ